MRILHLASSHRWTGAAEPALDLAVEQRALGHEPEFACIEGHSFWRYVKKRGVPFVSGLSFKRGSELGSMAADVRKLRRIVAERRYDVVHCHLTHDHWLAATALRSPFDSKRGRAGGPILVRTLHRDNPPGRDPIHRWLFGKATDLTITVSSSLRAELLARYSLAESRVAWVRGAVDTNRFHPGLDRQLNRTLWAIPPAAPVAGIIARMQPHRGHLDFIQTMEAVYLTVPEAVYLIAGRGEAKVAIKGAVRAHPQSEHFRWIGYRKKDLAESYAAMDVSVLLARGSDGSCRAMLEAMACGRPVIGVRTGAIAETIEPGITGWLIDPRNIPAELPPALCEALSDPVRTAEMGRAAREKMERDFSQRGRAEKTMAAYASAMRERQADAS